MPEVLPSSADGEEAEWIPTSDVGLFADLPLLQYDLEPLPSGTPLYVELTVTDFGGNSDSIFASSTSPDRPTCTAPIRAGTRSGAGGGVPPLSRTGLPQWNGAGGRRLDSLFCIGLPHGTRQAHPSAFRAACVTLTLATVAAACGGGDDSADDVTSTVTSSPPPRRPHGRRRHAPA